MNLESLLKALYGMGFNVIPVRGKKPNTRDGTWGSERKPLEELLPLPQGTTGLAIIGGKGVGEIGEDYSVVILDVDDPGEGGKILSAVFGEDWFHTLCGQPYSFCGLSGPRPKGKVRCSGCDPDAVCSDGNVEKPLSQWARGMYIVLRVPRDEAPSSTVRGGSIEVLVNNYQVVVGEHESGACYEIITGPGPGVVVTGEELARVIRLITGGEGRFAGKDVGVNVPDCNEWARVVDVNGAADLLYELWPARKNENHLHDVLTFSLASLLRRECVDYSDARRIIELVTERAVGDKLDTPSNARHHLSVVDWVYGDKGRVWGRDRFREFAREAAQALNWGDDEFNEWLDKFFAALGVTKESFLCIPISRAGVRGVRRLRPYEYICNTKSGIVKRTHKYKEKEDGGGEEHIDEKVLLTCNVATLTLFVDTISSIEYVKAVVSSNNALINFNMKRRGDFVRELNNRFRVRNTPDWSPIIDKFPVVRDIIVSGFVCPKESINGPCKIRDYFDVGINIDPDPSRAREALTLIINNLSNHPTPEQALAAYALGSFTNFSLTQRLWGVKPKAVAFVGVKDSGKSTIARMIVSSYAPKAVDLLFKTASGVLTAARVGRLSSQHVVTTIPVVFDEGRMAIEKIEVSEVIKSYLTPGNYIAWETAHNERYPGYAGLIFTMNQLPIEDPALAEKMAQVSFPESIPEALRESLSGELGLIMREAINFGAYYLRYAERNWERVKDIILLEGGRTWEGAAIEYFRLVASSLGVDVEINYTPEKIDISYSWKLARMIMDRVREFQMQCRGSQIQSLGECVNTLIDGGYLDFIKRHITDGKEHYRILRKVAIELGIPPDVLCMELDGELITNTRDTNYKSCVIPREKLLEILNITDANKNPQ